MAQVRFLHRPGLSQPFEAHAAVNPYSPVKLTGTSLLKIAPAATATDRPHGFTHAASQAAGEMTNVLEESNIVVAIAGVASFGVGQEMMVGPSGIVPALAASLFAASGHWAVGISQSAVVGLGEQFSLYVKPRKA